LALVLLGLVLPSGAIASCPSNVPIRDALTCTSTVSARLANASSVLGGTCAASDCYACGQPATNRPQTGPEHVYSFACQQNGTVNIDLTNLDCDLDFYVIGSACDPFSSCVQGSTSTFSVTDTVTFTCVAGQIYYVVVEGYGWTINGPTACSGGGAGDSRWTSTSRRAPAARRTATTGWTTTATG
jgi:hypothetical protein